MGSRRKALKSVEQEVQQLATHPDSVSGTHPAGSCRRSPKTRSLSYTARYELCVLAHIRDAPHGLR